MKLVHVRFRGPLAERLKHCSVELSDDMDTVGQVVQYLIDSNPEIQTVWASPAILVRDALVMKNEVDISLSGGLDTKLSHDDEIVVLPLIHGG